MGTLIYIILHLLGKVEHDDDWWNLCQLISMDSIAFVLLLHWWSNRRKLR